MENDFERPGKCELCEREVQKLTKHHLIPRQKGGNHGPIALLCRSCHKTLHNTYTNSTLAVLYNSLEKIRDAEELQGYLKWIKKQDQERVKIAPVKKKR